MFDLFKIGIRPSSSHPVGPMRATEGLLGELRSCVAFEEVIRVRVRVRVRVDLYGSLALTGVGHGTDTAVLIGLLGETPDEINPASAAGKPSAIRGSGEVALGGRVRRVPFRHTYKPLLIGSIRADGRFDIVTETPLVKPDSFSRYLHTPAELAKLTGAKP